jgi:hypothetical protein
MHLAQSGIVECVDRQEPMTRRRTDPGLQRPSERRLGRMSEDRRQIGTGMGDQTGVGLSL